MVKKIALLCFVILNSKFAIRNSFANELTVDKRTLTLNDSLTITLILTNNFASADPGAIPLQNLVIDGGPSVANEFQWVNGQAFRRKVLQYSAHARQAGAALVGPLVLRAADGAVETLAPVSIQVVPDAAFGSNDADKVMRELVATGRDPVFLIAEADRASVFAGEEVVVTWTLYSAVNVQQWGLGELPALADFWTEELDVRSEQPRQVGIGGQFAQKLVVRRAALFPLRSGTLDVESMTLNAAILKRVASRSPFGLFEGALAEVRARSAPLRLEVRAVPPPPVDLVGDATLQCFAPVQANGGPVSIDVVLSGRANLRAAKPPRFASPLGGSVQISERPLTVQRTREEARMSRRWRYLIFPESNGAMVIPPMTTTTLTSEGVRQELRCAERTLIVTAALPASAAAPVTPREQRGVAARRTLWSIGAVALALIALAIAVPPLQRGQRARRRAKALLRATPPETRAAAEAWLVERGIDPAALLREPSDRGDAWRAARSLLDALEHERLETPRRELRRRLRDLVVEIESHSPIGTN